MGLRSKATDTIQYAHEKLARSNMQVMLTGHNNSLTYVRILT